MTENFRIKIVALDEELYPALLKQIHKPPGKLYYRGSLQIFSRPCLAVVGTRKISAYGAQATDKIIRPLARSGLGIISGLAFGVDALAHALTLEENGLTAAVLGCGLDTIYPATHRQLAEDIIKKGGCLISEFPPGVPAFKTNFPRRNRLIAGLTLGTLVIEAAEKSGSLITARHALHDNREVLAVPGSIFAATSAGTNQLIKLGASVVRSAEDVLEILKLDQLPLSRRLTKSQTLCSEEAQILALLNHEPLHINEIAQATQLDMRTINSRLTIMEMNGLLKNTGNMQYVRLS